MRASSRAGLLAGRPARLAGAVALVPLAFLAAACSAPRGPEILSPAGTATLTGESLEYPRLVFANGQESLNDRCIVRQRGLNPKMPPVYVNGKPIGFC